MRSCKRNLDLHPIELRRRRPVGLARAGWSLIELLVVIGILAIILSIALPALSKARWTARRTKSEVNARTLVMAILTYADTHQERFPFGELDTVYPATSRDDFIGFNSWYENYRMWPGVIYDTLPFDENADVYHSPLGTYPGGKARAWPTSYFYSSTFTGDPRIWTPGFVADPTFLRATTLSEVVNPSGKALVWDNELGIGREVETSNMFVPMPQSIAIPVGFVDASVRSKRLDESHEPVTGTISGGPSIPGARLCNTANGVRGTDY